jgi:two-component system chemotaxis response regulator CheY
MRILIVDDDAKNRKLLTHIVNRFGECQAVESGTEAIMAFKDAWMAWRPFGLILMDIMMPGMSGEEALASIRQMERERKIDPDHQAKIIMITALSDMEIVKRCFQAGCNDYIVKPFDAETVLQKLAKLGTLKKATVIK